MQETPLLIDKTIVLVGLMGCGKSSLGKRLAKKLNIAFFDTDVIIEQEEKRTISEIFKTDGEAYFRDVEHKVLKQCLLSEPCILASGGGLFIEERNREIISKLGISLWLKVDYDILLERVSRKKTRPLLEQGNKAEILKQLLESRYPVYEKADITVETSNKPHEQMIEKITEAIKHYNESNNE